MRGTGLESCQVRFYTGVPNVADNPDWYAFWTAKLAVMGWQKIVVYSRCLRYRNKILRLPDGTEQTLLTGEEKGIDVRIALDTIRMAHRGEYDVALLFSQDQDFTEVAEEIRVVAREQQRRGVPSHRRNDRRAPLSPESCNHSATNLPGKASKTMEDGENCPVPAALPEQGEGASDVDLKPLHDWRPILDVFRTLCLAPEPKERELLERAWELKKVA